jgi:hypothetical protein
MFICLVIASIALLATNASAGNEDSPPGDGSPHFSELAPASESSPPAQSQEQPPSTPHWRFNLTPRVAIRQSTAGVTSVSPEASNFGRATLDLTTSIEAGASFAVAPPGWSRTELVATVMSVPSSSGLFETVVLSPIPFAAVGSFEANRLDVELLMRRHMGETQAYWVAGLEHIRLDSKRRGPSIFQILDSDSVRRSYFAKGGLGGSLNLSPSGRHQLFTDLLVSVGVQTEKTDFSNLAVVQNDSNAAFGFDVGAGYRFFVTKTLAIGVRYRAQGAIVSRGTAETAVGESDLRMLHGLEFHVSVPF